MSVERPAKYPEHAKRARAEGALALEHVRAFLAWFIDEREPRGFLGNAETECQVRETVNELLMEYAGIDAQKIEAERRAMLDAAHEASKP